MSELPENELDLEKLFLPAWAQEPSSAKRYTHYEGGGESRDHRGDGRGPRRREGPPGDRPRGGGPPGARRGPPRREGDRKKPFDDPRRPFTGREQREPIERLEPAPLPELNVNFVPDERGVESLARQIRTTGRAYPLFDIARLILERPERYAVTFSIKKNPEGKPIQPLFACLLDETLWLSENEAIAHVLKNHFATFYQAERTATEPPKGKYTFVAQCGMSGIILGPPNYHDYQNQLRKLHAERFSRLPFEVFKSRVKIVRDEAVVKQWIEGQSFKTEYVCLNLPEPLRLATREEVEKHFRDVHRENIIKPAESHTMSGAATRNLRSPDLARLSRVAWETQRRFPLQIATVLSQQFAGHGLQFFKVNKTITHVSVARPYFLDLTTTPVSEGVKRIVEFIDAHPKCTRRKLVEALAPSPAAAPAPAAGAPAGKEEAATAVSAEPSPEQTAVIADLHWLIHQGHVIEFANGTLDTAKKPVPRPPKPERKKPAPAGEEQSAVVTAEPNVAVEDPPPIAEPAGESAVAAGEPETPAAPETPAGPESPESRESSSENPPPPDSESSASAPVVVPDASTEPRS